MIISIFAKDGAGKSTLAISLAEYYAKQENFTGLISAETRYGAIQRKLNINIPDKKSLLQAVLNPDSVGECFVKDEKRNIYVLSMPDSATVKDYDTATALLGETSSHQTEEQLKKADIFISSLKDAFDILIIDLTDRITDPLTYSFISSSDHVIKIITADIDGTAFCNAHTMLKDLSIMQNKTINILNKNEEKIINASTIEKLISEKIDVIIPYDEQILINSYDTSESTGKNMQNAVREINALLFPSEKQEKKKGFLRSLSKRYF